MNATLNRLHLKPKLTLSRLTGAVLMMALLSLILASPVYAVGVLVMDVNIVGDPVTVDTGEILTYVIDYSCASTVDDCGSLTIDFPLDPDTEFLEVITVTGEFTGSLEPGNVVRIVDNNIFTAGEASQATVRVRVRPDLTGPTTINVTVSGEISNGAGNNPEIFTSTPPTVFVNAPTPNWTVNKRQVLPASPVNPTPGGSADYEVEICSGGANGNVPLTGVTLVDTYAAGATASNISDGGTDNTPGPNQITWNLGDLAVDSGCTTRSYTLTFPDTVFGLPGNPGGLPSTTPNSVQATATNITTSTEPCGTNCLGEATLTPTLEGPRAEPTVSKSGPGTTFISPPTGNSVFFLEFNGLAANAPMENVVLTDTLTNIVPPSGVPVAFDIISIGSGEWGGGGTIQATVEIFQAGAWVPLGTVDGSGITWTNGAAFTTGTGNYITDIRWTFLNDLPAGFTFSANPAIRFRPNPDLDTTPPVDANPTDYDEDGDGPLNYHDYQNCLQASYTVNGGAAQTTAQSCTNARLSTNPNNYTNISVGKESSAQQIEPGQDITFTITLELTQEASAALVNPIIRDVLNENLDFVSVGTITYSQSIIDAGENNPGVAVNTTPVGASTQVDIAFTGTFTPPATGVKRITIPINARAKANAQGNPVTPGYTVDPYTNTVSIGSNSPQQYCEPGTITTNESVVGNLNGDGDSTDVVCQANSTFRISEAAAMRSEKWIRNTDALGNPFFLNPSNPTLNPNPSCPVASFNGNDYTRFPCVAQGVPNGSFEYVMVMTNTGRVNNDNYVMYDILPYIGDTGITEATEGQARDTEFSVFMENTGVLLDGANSFLNNGATFNVEYSDSTNPCRPEMDDPSNGGGWNGGCVNDWTATPDNWDDVRAFRIEQTGGVIAPGERMVFTAQMRINNYSEPTTPETPETGEIAWNNYGQRFNNADSGRILLPAEPPKVGIIVSQFSIGNIVWDDNGAGGGGIDNGIQDGTEAGIPNITMQLFRDANNNGTFQAGTDTLINTDVTDGSGFYLFESDSSGDSLAPGTYFVRIDPAEFDSGDLVGYISSTGVNNNETTDDNDNGIDPGNPLTYGTVGTYNRRVTLNPAVPLPVGEARLSGNPADGPDSRGNRDQADDASNLTIDFGLFKPHSIGNRVWLDDGAGGGTLNNGIIDGAEAGIGGVTLNLYRDDDNNGTPDGAAIATTTTTTGPAADAGYYIFDLLRPGRYIVQVAPENFDFVVGNPAADGPLARYLSSTGNGGDTETDSDVDENGIDPATEGIQRANGVYSVSINLEEDGEVTTETLDPNNLNPNGRRTDADSSELTVDFGFYQPDDSMSLGNRVWIDDGDGGGTANNGVQDGGEVGIEGVVVELFADNDDDGTPDGAAIATTATDATGYYLFDDLEPGRYLVRVAPSNWTATNPGGTALVLENYFSSTGFNNTDATDADDLNDNGRDPADYAAHVANGIISDTVSLIPQGEPTGEVLGPQGNGVADANDSDLTVDFGVYRPMSLGNLVWYDTANTGGAVPGDGIFQPAEGEVGVNGVLVQLYRDGGDGVFGDGAGNPGGDDAAAIDDTTANGGFYLFDGLVPGTYFVHIPASNWTAGQPLDQYVNSDGVDGTNGDDTADDDDNGIDPANYAAHVANGVTSDAIVLVAEGEPAGETRKEAIPNPDGANVTVENSDLTKDFGFYQPPMSLGNRVWNDLNNNGAIDTGEAGIPSVDVALFEDANADGTPDGAAIATDTTDANGLYLFENLTPGTYLVQVVPANWNASGPLENYSSSTGATATENTDNNDNGIDAIDYTAQTTNGILSGPVVLSVEVEPAGETEIGGIPNTSGQNPFGVAIADNNSDLTVDFGFFRPMSLGNLVWRDTANTNGAVPGDGVFQPAEGEVGIDGVLVQLYRDGGDGVFGDGAGNPGGDDAAAIDDTTANGGFYLFDGLLPGTYFVHIPDTNWGTGQPLNLHLNSDGVDGTNGDNAEDDDDNGVNLADYAAHVATGVTSTAITLTREGETDTETRKEPGVDDGLNVTPLNSDLTIDFGFYVPPLSIGNRVWFDTDVDGLMEPATEPFINGITVNLYEDANGDNDIEAGELVATTETANNGFYLFDNLPPGNYFVQIDPNEFNAGQELFAHLSTITANPLNETTNYDDNGIDPANLAEYTTRGVVSNRITLTPDTMPVTTDEPGDDYLSRGANGEEDDDSNLSVDFGFWEPLAIGNRVWNDNGAGGGVYDDGIQNGTEAGIPGIVVNLYTDTNGNGTVELPGEFLATDTTDGNGYYIFDGLKEGEYIVEIAAENFDALGDPLYETFSSNRSNTEADDGVDQHDKGIDDPNPETNGIRSPQVTLQLRTEPAPSNPTDDTDLGPEGNGTNNEQDDASDLTVDFGFVAPPMSIGNRVWYDWNNNGEIEATEGFIGGVRVDLYADTNTDGLPQAGEFVRSDTTNADGYYLFDGLTAGRYIVVVNEQNFRTGGPLVNFFSTQNPANPTDDNTDATPGNITGTNTEDGFDTLTPEIEPGIRSAVIDLIPSTEIDTETDKGPRGDGTNGEEITNSNLTVDFGFYQPMSIGNRVWFDTDSDGLIGPTENGAANVSVSLFFDGNTDGIPDGPAIATELTDANGYYLFDNLPPNNYVVRVDPVNFGAGGVLQGIESTVTGVTSPPAEDNNDNGIDPADYNNGVLSETVTLTLGLEPTGENDFSGNVPLDGPNSIGVSGEINANSDISIDFGFNAPMMSLGNRVWLDLGRDGIRQDGEATFDNVALSLYRDTNGDGTPDGAAIDTTTTADGGYYLFEGIVPGRYLVGIDRANFDPGGPLEGYASTLTDILNPIPPENAYTNPAEVDSNDNGIDAINATYGILSSTVEMVFNGERSDEADLGTAGNGAGISAENSDLTIDFGFFKPMSIGNRVWFDTNDNGLIDPTESGVANVFVSVYVDANNNGTLEPTDPLVKTQQTDANGYYLVDGVPQGVYLVQVDPVNFAGGGPLEGTRSSTGVVSDKTIDSNDNGIDGTDVATVGVPADALLIVLDSEPNGETDLSGNPRDGANSRGNNGETDNNSNLTIDFGFVPGEQLSLGNRVWLDDNADGLISAGESGIAGVNVSLYRDSNSDGTPDGAAIATEPTDANGYYLFDGLTQGSYLVGIDAANFGAGGALLGYASTLSNVDDNPTDTTPPERVDSNDNRVTPPREETFNPTFGILSATIPLQPNTAPLNEVDLSGNPIDGPQSRGNNGETDGSSDLTIDFGFYPSMTLGNRVWFDSNNNALIDLATEVGIAGVSVSLYRDDNQDGTPDDRNDNGTFGDPGDAVAVDTTDANGYYLFNNVSPNSYVVGVDGTNFNTGRPLFRTTSSTGFFTDNIDSNDNGVDTADSNGHILSETVTLVASSAPVGETDLSGNTSDGPNFRGINNESDNNSNLTVDFGFVANPMSLGNKVWLDDGAGGGVNNNGQIDGAEVGLADVVMQLYSDSDGDGTPDSLVAPIATDTTDANGYYLFDGVPPGTYVVRVAPENFQAGGALVGLNSSTGSGPVDVSSRDQGIDNAAPEGSGILSASILMEQDSEPTITDEDDLSNNPEDGPAFRGNNGESDENSNLAVDFGFTAVYDWGDNPASYGTETVDNGPNHRIIPQLFMGSIVDEESDGQPTPGSNGDDDNGTSTDDEDGVKIEAFIAGTSTQIEVIVFNNTGSTANLVGWVDWNGNGTYEASEGTAITVDSSTELQTVALPVDVPLPADVETGGTTYARFRLTTDPIDTSSPTGSAVNGEVEDYQVTVEPPGLALTKTDNQPAIVRGQQTTYTITITNSGVDATNRRFVDTIPTADPDGFEPDSITWECVATDGASCIAGEPAGTGETGTNADIDTRVDIPRGGKIVYTVTATLRNAYEGGQVINEAEIEGGPKSIDINGVIFDPPRGVKTGVVEGGGTIIRWTQVWFNDSGFPATVVVTDPIQPGQTFAGNLVCTPFGSSSTTGCSYDGTRVIWEGTIFSGDANRVELAFDVTIPGDGEYNNVATLTTTPSGGGGGGVLGTTSTTVTTASTVSVSGGTGSSTGSGPTLEPATCSVLTSTITGAPPFVRPGEAVTWTASVTNETEEEVGPVAISIPLPPELENPSVSTTTGTAEVNGSTITLTLPSLPPGESVGLVVRSNVAPGVEEGTIITVPVRVNGNDCAAADVIVISELPATGETPAWRIWMERLLWLVVGLMMVGTTLAITRRQRLRAGH